MLPAQLSADSLSSGLVAYYPLATGSSDFSGYFNNLTLDGGASIAPSVGVFGGGALSLNNSFGSASDFAIAGATNSNLDFGSSPFAIQAWVNFADPSYTQTIIEQFTGGGGPGWSVSYIASGELEFYGSPGSGGFAIDESFTPSAGVWYQIFVVDMGGSIALYANTAGGGLNLLGSQSVSGSVPANTGAPPNPLGIGSRDGGAGLGFDGLVNEVAIWDRALTTPEMSELNTAPLSALIPEPSTFWVVPASILLLALARLTRGGYRRENPLR
jgi:hypothetical protein